jgi:hypothetical protein
MVNSPVIPDSELVNALNHSIAKSRFPGAYDAHKSVRRFFTGSSHRHVAAGWAESSARRPASPTVTKTMSPTVTTVAPGETKLTVTVTVITASVNQRWRVLDIDDNSPSQSLSRLSVGTT